jgi:hypothetical protein
MSMKSPPMNPVVLLLSVNVTVPVGSVMKNPDAFEPVKVAKSIPPMIPNDLVPWACAVNVAARRAMLVRSVLRSRCLITFSHYKGMG